MKTYEFKLPDIGEGVTEGEIVSWLVKAGEVVKEDQPMVEVMTDKATVTITAPKAGKVLETRGKEGGVVPVHSVLVVFDIGGGAPAAPTTAPSAPIKPEPVNTLHLVVGLLLLTLIAGALLYVVALAFWIIRYPLG